LKLVTRLVWLLAARFMRTHFRWLLHELAWPKCSLAKLLLASTLLEAGCNVACRVMLIESVCHGRLIVWVVASNGA
jgi:hypothetical protein